MDSNFEITSPSQVAELTGLTRGAVSKLIDRLLAKKLVARSESSTDRRYQEVQLTAVAKKLIPKLAKIADENDEYFFSILSDSEKKALTKTLNKLTKQHKLEAHPVE